MGGVAMNHIEMLVTYWNEARGKSTIPDRAAIAPGRMYGSLAYMFIVEGRAGHPTFRVVGTALNRAFGMELRGIGMLGIWTPADAATVSSMLRQSVEREEPLTLNSSFVSVRGRDGELRLVCLPFRNREGGIGHVGAMEMDPVLPEGLDRIARTNLTTDRRTEPGGEDDAVRSQLAQLARRRGDGRANPDMARELRAMGGNPLQPVSGAET